LFLSSPFAQLLRYTAPADARSTIVRLRSARTASLAFEQNSALKRGKKRQKNVLFLTKWRTFLTKSGEIEKKATK